MRGDPSSVPLLHVLTEQTGTRRGKLTHLIAPLSPTRSRNHLRLIVQIVQRSPLCELVEVAVVAE